jgi:hypothetical protein
MKRGIIVAAAAISMTGAASANLFTTPALPPAQPLSREKPATVAAAPVLSPATPTPAQLSPPLQRASVDARQAPVPMQPKPRAPVISAWDNPNEFYAKAQALVGRPSAERSGENAARAAIEADGYKGVQEMRRGDGGVWHAKAFRGRTEVRLTVDTRGTVTTAD